MGLAGRCAICAAVCRHCITCQLCGRNVCIEHQVGGVCIDCLRGRRARMGK
ncbi:MAG: hypothetical protein N3H30_02975 [Candidatus Micrarchaeota archaeon]|nr:hypothetical protein [Candidatus Micrarchaeota archaeon]